MVWTIAFWLLLALGVGVLLWALFWDRAGWRGRAGLRCRKCWYDLTGSGGVETVSRASPVVCPECGRGHQSRRAMRRTRRRRWGVVLGLGLMAGAYGAGVWPRVSAYNFSAGWVGAVPTPALILSMPWLPEEPGSLLDRNSTPGMSIPYRQRPWGERFAHQITTRLYKPESTSRLDRWLFFRSARAESAAVLTEATAVRGDVYRYVVNAWVRQGRVSLEEEHWARRVHQISAEHTEYALDGMPTYARVRVRRLVQEGPWRVRIGETLFETKERPWPEGRDRFVDLRPVGLEVSGWWDGNVMIDRYMYLSSGYLGANPTTFTRTITGRIFEGDSYANVWWPVAKIAHEVEFTIARATRAGPDGPPGGVGPRVESITGFEVVADDQALPLMEWLESAIDVRLSIDGDLWSSRSSGLPTEMVLFIGESGRAPKELPAFTFGGNLSVVLEVRRGGGDPENPRIETVTVFECDPAWWALRDKTDDQGKRVFEHDWLRVGIRPTTWFRPRGGVIPGSDDGLAKNDEVIGAWLEVRFGTNRAGNEGFRPLADLEAVRFLTHTVRIPIEPGHFQYAADLRSDSVRMPLNHARGRDADSGSE